LNTRKIKPGHKKNSQAMSYMKETRMLRSLNSGNTKSTGVLKPFRDATQESSETINNARRSNCHTLKHESPLSILKGSYSCKKLATHRVGKSLRFDYVNKKKRMNKLNSSTNLKKHLSTSKSFSSLQPSSNCKNSSVTDFGKQMQHEKGVRKCEIKLVNQSTDMMRKSKRYGSTSTFLNNKIQKKMSSISREYQSVGLQPPLGNTSSTGVNKVRFFH